jgi:hypothetical protein
LTDLTKLPKPIIHRELQDPKLVLQKLLDHACDPVDDLASAFHQFTCLVASLAPHAQDQSAFLHCARHLSHAFLRVIEDYSSDLALILSQDARITLVDQAQVLETLIDRP